MNNNLNSLLIFIHKIRTVFANTLSQPHTTSTFQLARFEFKRIQEKQRKRPANGVVHFARKWQLFT